MKEAWKFQKLTDLMALLTFAVFAVCVLLVLLTGADVYQNLTATGESLYDCRTAAQYITTRVRQADADDGIFVEDFDGQDALVLRESVNGQTYLTRVYCYDGYLWELFTAEGGEFSPEDGEKLLEAADFSVTMDGQQISVTVSLPDGSVQELTLYLRSGKEASP